MRVTLGAMRLDRSDLHPVNKRARLVLGNV
jgi:hypothetical protein